VTAAPTAGTTSLTATRTTETARGTARTLSLPGGGYLVVHAFGEVSLVSPQGGWSRDTQSLYRDWGLTWQTPGYTETPQLAWGSNPVYPLEFSGEGTGLVNNVTPYAAGELDGQFAVAVAETVGVNMTSQSSCEFCSWPFDVPGGSLHLGTFVTVFDGRTGRTLYHELDPGYVTQLAIAGGRLIIGDETGDPQRKNGIGQWGSVSTLKALPFTRDATATRDATTELYRAQPAWTYSTKTPWARLLDVSVTARDEIALAWSDTPPGLGTPGPPDGHVLLLDARTGEQRWQVRTPGYPVLTAADDSRGELAVVQLTDPLRSTGYTLTGLRYSDGSTEVSAPRSGSLPVSLATGGQHDDWAVGAVDATVPAGELAYIPLHGRVTLTDPRTGTDLWSVLLPSSNYGVPVPGGLVLAGDRVAAGAWLGAVSPTAATPLQQADSLTFLDYETGVALSSATGDPGDPLSLSVAGPGGHDARVRAVTSHQVMETYSADGSATDGSATADGGAGPGDFLTAVTASVSAPSATDLVAGNEDGGVYALDGRSLAAGTAEVLWRTQLPGPVHQIVHAELGGQPVLVAAATSAVAVLDPHSGRVLRLIPVAGTYVYTVTVIAAAALPGRGGPAVVVPGTSLTAYSLADGALLWQYAAPAGASFSNAVSDDGVVAAEYSSSAGGFPTYRSAEIMAAVAVDTGTGALVWSVAEDGTAIMRGQLWNGVAAGPDGIAFTWQTRDGRGEVDVRDAATGALAYSDTSSDLALHTEYLRDASLGLIAVSQEGAVRITASGGESSYRPSGLSGALARSASGAEALLVSDAGTTAWGTDVFTNASATSLGSDETYLAGALVSGDFADDGSRQVVAIPGDWLAYRVVNAESGNGMRAWLETVQHGLAVLRLSDSAASGTTSTSRAASSSRATASAPGATRAVGQVGSAAPSPEPVRTGVLQTGISPATVRHDAASVPAGYSPALIGKYLGLSGDGSGQTVAIVDAYDDPNIAADAEAFSEQYGLPGVCGAGGAAGDCFMLDVREQDAGAGSSAGWALETSLDVEWVHAIAPRARIVLVEAADASFASMFAAVQTAEAVSPAAVSMSWGIGEEFSDETWYDHFCAVTSTACVVSAGDYGHPGSYPAYNPAVISVGGTTLSLSSSGSVSSELAWSGSGGGQSWVEREPAYQRAAQDSGMRQIPDVSFDADPNTGVAVYDSVRYLGLSGWWQVGGTSFGAPAWSAILAAADQLRASAGKGPLTAAGVGAALYSLPSGVLARITGGADNGFCPSGCAPGAGYDEITGLGSPRAGIDVALSGS
jgi:hypothetical protein